MHGAMLMLRGNIIVMGVAHMMTVATSPLDNFRYSPIPMVEWLVFWLCATWALLAALASENTFEIAHKIGLSEGEAPAESLFGTSISARTEPCSLSSA